MSPSNMDLLSFSEPEQRHPLQTAATPPTSNGSAAVAALTTTTASVDPFVSLWSRYDQHKLGDVYKNVFMEEILTKYESLSRTHAKFVQDVEAEREFVRTSVARERKLNDGLQMLQNLLNRDPFILVLLDGTGCIFRTNFMNDGEEGGRRAASLLHTAISEWSQANVDELPRDARLVVRVYANIKGLARGLYSNAAITSAEVLNDFVHGFTYGNTLFDFVDIGPGREHAADKIAALFKLHLLDYHCRQIILGCSSDNCYGRLLRQHADSVEAKSRITLLETVPFEKELASLPFNYTRLDSLFRDVKINMDGAESLGYRPRLEVKTLSAASSVFTPSDTIMIAQMDGAQHGLYAFPPAIPSHLRCGSITSSGDSSESGIGSISFAAAAQKAAKLPDKATTASTLHTSAPGTATTIIRRNKLGQRIDPVPTNYNRDDVARVKKLKMCNQHYLVLGSCCHTQAKCPHTHQYKPTKAELEMLKLVARESPCRHGTKCDDAKCIHGHRCPFPPATEGSMRGRGCMNGSLCRFPLEMHDMDMIPAKASK